MKPLTIKILFTLLIVLTFALSLAAVSRAELMVNDLNDGHYVPSDGDLITVIN